MNPTLAAFEHNGATVERAHFYAIACDPRRSVAVEACAGAGKTWMLVSRMVRALLQGCPPQEILAITFTKKAAGEMRQRLHEWLLKFATATDATLRQELRDRGFTQEPSAEQLQSLRKLHSALLCSGRQVQIRTFHSWFAALLRSAPLSVLQELGLPTQYELLENDVQAVAQTWSRFQQRVVGMPDAREDYLCAVATHGRHQTQKALAAALVKRVEFALADGQGVVDISVRHFAQQFPDFEGLQEPQQYLLLGEMRKLLLDAARLLGVATQSTCITAAIALEQGLAQGDVAAVQDALLTRTGTARKFSEKLHGIATVRQAQEAVLRMAAATEQHQAWLHQQRMARLTRILTADYADLKRARGWIDMCDLERAALALMSDPVLSGWVQERLDARVQHLMIDEFQDTNPLQWQALSAWLSGYTGAGQAPSVFLVGDPKQSIYRFRRAEPQVFKAAQRLVVEGLGGDLLSCDHTRRNASAIVDLVNHVMAQAQSALEFDGFRHHSTESTHAGHVFKLARIAREVANAGGVEVAEAVVWRNSLTMPRRLAEETRKTQECRQAAHWLLEQMQAKPTALAPRDIMVLARKRERLALMQTELAAVGIAALQPEKTDLGARPEVQDVVALLDALVSPTHDLSLARALKSPLFGVSDSDLVQLALSRRAMQDALAVTSPPFLGNVTWWQVLQQTNGLPPGLATLGAVLLTWKRLVDSLPPHDALCTIYRKGDVLARYAAMAPAAERESVLANLNAVLAAALQIDAGRYASAYALVRALRAGGIQAPMRADVNAVRLLTIHGAKGLEAPLVLMLDSDGEAPRPESMGVLVDWPGESRFPQRFVFLASESHPPACVADALRTEQSARRREEINALYVALTRAQHTLVLSSLEPHIANAQSWWQRMESLATEAPWQTVSAQLSLPTVEQQTLVSYALLSLPFMPADPADHAQDATEKIVESLESRVGQAMHRLLEWVTAKDGGVAQVTWAPVQIQSIRRTFDLDISQVELACGMARCILVGEAVWAWDTKQVAWQRNEVAVAHQGRLLRIDRLVQHRASGHWWVLDYKSNTQPQLQAALRSQLLGYRAAVEQAQRGTIVRVAFLTADGRLLEIDPP